MNTFKVHFIYLFIYLLLFFDNGDFENVHGRLNFLLCLTVIIVEANVVL